MDTDEKMYSIGEVAALTNLSQQTLRYYDAIKLMVPECRDECSGYRYYTEQQVILLMIVRRLRDIKCKIEDIRPVINEKHMEEIYNLLCKRNLELEDEIVSIRKKINTNNELIDRIARAIMLKNSETAVKYDVEKDMRIEELPVVSLFCERRNHIDYNFQKTSLDHWSALYSGYEKLKLNIVGPPIVTFHTELLGQFIMRDCEFTLALQVDPRENCKKIKKGGGITAATAIHKGSYATMVETYIQLLQWINENGYEAHAPASEEFIISPIECLEPEMLITKIIIPVAKPAKKEGKHSKS